MLQEIEIQRFKSIDSVRLELAPLTLLVGPNASGAFDRSRANGTLARNAAEMQGFRELADSKGVDYLLLDG